MPLARLFFNPGIDKQNTEYGAEGGWIDGDYIRFRYGLPEKIGGWRDFNLISNALVGQISDILTWNALDSSPYLAVGTTRKLYVYNGGTFFDITPIRLTTGVGDVTFAATTGSNVLTVTDNNHGAIVGDFVTFSGAVSLGGAITAAILNSEYEIRTVVNTNTYTIQAPVNANSSDSGNGGASVVGRYQINVGSDVSVFDFCVDGRRPKAFPPAAPNGSQSPQSVLKCWHCAATPATSPSRQPPWRSGLRPKSAVDKTGQIPLRRWQPARNSG